MTTNPKRFELWDVDSWMLIDRDVNLFRFFVQDGTPADDMVAIETLPVGHSWHFGGGAAPLCALRRVA